MQKTCASDDKTYTAQVYCNGRPDSGAEAITPLRKLEDGLYLQELSNGPTLAFKDMSAVARQSVLPRGMPCEKWYFAEHSWRNIRRHGLISAEY